MKFSLLTVMGKVTQESIEATCRVHNETAGNPGGVAAAKALGDMSHLTFMPTDARPAFRGDLLFMDIWNDLDGLNKFFSDPQVQGGAAMMFRSREAIVWNKLDSFLNFQLPVPTGKNKKIVGLVKGTVRSLVEAEKIHNTAIAGQVTSSRAAGIISHEFYVRLAAPGTPESLEVLGVDVWMDEERMMQHYRSPGFQNSGLYKIFASKPAQSIWEHPEGDWVEW